MRSTLFSPSWYRVAQLKPRLRSHAQIHRHSYRDEIWYILQEHASGRMLRFTPGAYQLIGLMDGRRSVQEIWEIGRERLEDDAPTQEEMIRILSQLHAVDVLACDVPPDTLELLRRHEKKTLDSWTQNLRNPMSMRFRLFDPEPFLLRWMGVVRPFFGWGGLILWLVVVGWALFLAGIHWKELTHGVTDRVLAPENLVLVWCIFPLLKACHELGHAFAVKRLGGEVHEIGLIFLVFTPVPYVDASAATAFRNKWERVLVGAAGMVVEIFLAALAMFVWVLVEPGPIRGIAFNIMAIAGVSSLLFNCNPLLRYDGYYMLIDLIEIPNLGPRGISYLAYLAQRYLFGLRDAEPPFASSGEKAWFVGYTISSFVYRIFIYVGIILLVADKFFVVGILIALWAMASMILLPLFKVVKFLAAAPQLNRKRTRAWVISLGMTAALAALVCLVPVPLSTRTEGVTWIPEEAFVRAGADSEIERIETRPGSFVHPGDLLIRCADPFLPARIKSLEARVQELKIIRAAQILTDRLKAQITEEEMGHAQQQLDDAHERYRELSVYSQTEGQFLVLSPQDLPGAFVKRGQVIGYVVQPASVSVRVVVSQPDADLVRNRPGPIEIRRPDSFETIAVATFLREVPAATDKLPARVLGQAGGGTVVVDPRDEKGMKSFQKIFLFDIEPPDGMSLSSVGGRVYVRFDHGREALVWRWYRELRDLLLSRFNV